MLIFDQLIDKLQVETKLTSLGFKHNQDSSKTMHPSHYNAVHLREFVYEGNKEVKIIFYNRARQISVQAGERFEKVLNSPEHELTAQEIEDIGIVLYDEANEADLTLVSTKSQVIGSKRTVVMDAAWKSSQMHDLGLYTNTDPDYRVVTEIHCLAPEGDYQKVRPLFEQFLATLSCFNG